MKHLTELTIGILAGVISGLILFYLTAWLTQRNHH